MIEAGNATIMVSDLDQAIRFYTEVLGLRLQYRAGTEIRETPNEPVRLAFFGDPDGNDLYLCELKWVH